VTNVGSDTLIIREVEASCGCTTPEVDIYKILPGKKSRIKTTFNSRGRIGHNEKLLTIFSNDPKEPTKNIIIKGKVLPK
jgi:hypothetical protein